MAKDAANPKDRMVATTLDLLRNQGYHGTGLNQIVQESRAPKGSLYHYFPGGKEELAAEAIKQGVRESMAEMSQHMVAASSYVEGLVAFLEATARKLEESDYRAGCPIAAVSLEACCGSDLIQQSCSRSFAGLEQSITSRLLVEGVPPERAHDLATLLLSAYEGAVMLCRAHRSPKPMQALARELPRLLGSIS